MTREEAREILTHNWTRVDNPNYSESELDEAFFMAIEALSADAVSREFYEDAVKANIKLVIENRKLKEQIESADAVPIVYCMDCAKSVPLDEHGALWKCKAHDRTTLRHSYCNNGERKGGDSE